MNLGNNDDKCMCVHTDIPQITGHMLAAVYTGLRHASCGYLPAPYRSIPGQGVKFVSKWHS